MRRINSTSFLIAAAMPALLLASCKRAPAPVAPPPPTPVAQAPAPMPRPPLGAATTLAIPAALPDGSYPTPNRNLSQAATTWHVRSALNVAALGCNIADPTVVASYNAMQKAHAATLKSAHTTLAAEYRQGGGDWQDRFDDTMTRLYNFFAQPPVHDRFCAIAVPMIAEAAALPPSGFAAFAQGALPTLDQPFADFYRDYDRYRVELAAWRAGQGTASASQVAVAVPAAVPMAATPASGHVPVTAAAPKLRVDPAVLMASDLVTTGRGMRVASR